MDRIEDNKRKYMIRNAFEHEIEGGPFGNMHGGCLWVIEVL
jgi:hypothetical protein